MKKIVLILLPFALLLAACRKVEKDVHNYYPKVKTTGAVVLPDGSVQVTGEIISEGNTPVLYNGFCMDTLPNPGMLSNQQSLEVTGNTFTCTYTALGKSHKYYFRAWAANEHGYAIGDDVSVDSVTISPSAIPCTLPVDTFTINNTLSTKNHKYISISKLTQSTLTWTVSLATNSHTVDMEFGRKPIGGTYTVSDNISDKTGVQVMIDNTIVNSGSKVYVTEINSNTIEVTVCSMDFYDGMSVNNVRTRFRASYQ